MSGMKGDEFVSLWWSLVDVSAIDEAKMRVNVKFTTG